MNFSVEQVSNSAILSSHVEKLDISNVSELKNELILLNKNGINNVIFDMSKTRYCDSSGLSGILIGNRLCKDTNGLFILTGIQDNVMKMLKIAQLDKVLHIEESLESAKSNF